MSASKLPTARRWESSAEVIGLVPLLFVVSCPLLIGGMALDGSDSPQKGDQRFCQDSLGSGSLACYALNAAPGSSGAQAGGHRLCHISISRVEADLTCSVHLHLQHFSFWPKGAHSNSYIHSYTDGGPAHQQQFGVQYLTQGHFVQDWWVGGVIKDSTPPHSERCGVARWRWETWGALYLKPTEAFTLPASPPHKLNRACRVRWAVTVHSMHF